MQITKKILRTVSSPSAFVKVWNKTPLWRFSRLLADSVYFRKIRQRRVLLGFNNQQESVHLKALRDQGFSVITDLVDQSILDELRSYSEGKLQRANEIAAQQVVGTKSFWIRLSDDDLAEKALDEKHILVKFGIQKRLIELVGRYLGELPVSNA